ncbi:MAG: metal ABC transporter substrate-binding protein [bacterium]|nr:metal ABC transporter substrate-binding protein [bacterium]
MKLKSLLILAVISISLSGCAALDDPNSRNTEISDEDFFVLASIPPLHSMALNIGGEVAIVENLLPAGASPHEYSLTPSDLTSLAKADVLIIIGLGMETFLEDAIISSANPDLVIIDASKGVNLILGNVDENDSQELTADPHIWLSVHNAKIMVDNIATGLATTDPTNAEIYNVNAEAYKQRLSELDAFIEQQLQSISTHNFIALHPAWEYFANEYGLTQEAAIEVVPGQEPSAKQMIEIIDQIKESDVTTLFSEPQLSDRVIKTIANDTGLPIHEIDPLGSGTFSETLYEDTMISNAKTFATALK